MGKSIPVLLGLILFYGQAHAQVVCDRFEIKTKIIINTMRLSLDTDLPANARIQVSVYRTYRESGNKITPCRQRHHYLLKTKTAVEWSKPLKVDLSPNRWMDSLISRLKKSSQAGKGYQAVDFGRDLYLTAELCSHQENKKFGKKNSKLRGKAVLKPGKRVLKKKKLKLPLPPHVRFKPFPNLNPKALEKTGLYIISAKTPLLRRHPPYDRKEEIKHLKLIPRGGSFRVLEVYLDKNTPWYRVKAYDQKRKPFAQGWICSKNLASQRLDGIKA